QTVLGGSSSGRTTDSDSVYLGSNPSPPAKNDRARVRGPFSFLARGLGSRARSPGSPRRGRSAAGAQVILVPEKAYGAPTSTRRRRCLVFSQRPIILVYAPRPDHSRRPHHHDG